MVVVLLACVGILTAGAVLTGLFLPAHSDKAARAGDSATAEPAATEGPAGPVAGEGPAGPAGPVALASPVREQFPHGRRR